MKNDKTDFENNNTNLSNHRHTEITKEPEQLLTERKNKNDADSIKNKNTRSMCTIVTDFAMIGDKRESLLESEILDTENSVHILSPSQA